jgi:DHA1 family multidrug resistance protein-like MFS transporter
MRTAAPANLGEVVTATEVITSGVSSRRARHIILLLSASVCLMMTGLGIIIPVFARRLGEFGSGVEALGLMTMSFALAQFVAAPFMGSLADRIGRRPVILMALAAFALANIGFLFASSTKGFIAVRALEGAFTAGLFPAALGIVGDIAPEDQRGKWVGIVMSSYMTGFIFGPVIGGVLYDGWGFAAPFVASATLAIIAFIAASILVPETRTREVRRREELRQRREDTAAPEQGRSFWSSLPRPLHLFGTLLVVDFVIFFAFAFVEPQMVFYFYEELGWSTIQFGAVIGVYASAMVIGQATLGRLSDQFGRRRLIVVGLLLNATFFVGLIFVSWFPLMMAVAVVSGLGEALVMPALSAFYLDISAEQHRSRVMGLKESADALGGVAGPLLLVVVAATMTPQGVFVIGGVVTLFAAGLALAALKTPRLVSEGEGDMAWELSGKRSMAAQTSLRGIFQRATTARETRRAAR